MNVIANELIVNEFDCKCLYSTGGLNKVIFIASELIGSEYDSKCSCSCVVWTSIKIYFRYKVLWMVYNVNINIILSIIFFKYFNNIDNNFKMYRKYTGWVKKKCDLWRLVQNCTFLCNSPAWCFFNIFWKFVIFLVLQ